MTVESWSYTRSYLVLDFWQNQPKLVSQKKPINNVQWRMLKMTSNRTTQWYPAGEWDTL